MPAEWEETLTPPNIHSGDGPTISVIIAAYKRSRYLAEAIESLAAQTYPPHEVIIVDDCSPEPVLVPEFPGLGLTCLRHGRNQGPAAARNTGFAHSSGDWVVFLDDDDLLTPRRLERAVTGMGDSYFHAAGLERFYPDGRSVRATTKFEGDLRNVFLDGSEPYGSQPQLGQVVFRREDFIQFNPTLRRAEDSEWWLRQSDRAIFSWDDEVGIRQRMHAEDRNYMHLADYFQIRRMLAQTYGPTSSPKRRATLYSKVAGAALQTGRRWHAVLWSARSLGAQRSRHALKQLVRSLLPSTPSSKPTSREV